MWNKFPGWICYTRAEDRQHCCFEMSSAREYFISRPTSQPTLSWRTRVQHLNVNIAYRQRFACYSRRYFLTWFYICIFVFCHKSFEGRPMLKPCRSLRTLAFWYFLKPFCHFQSNPHPSPGVPTSYVVFSVNKYINKMSQCFFFKASLRSFYLLAKCITEIHPHYYHDFFIL